MISISKKEGLYKGIFVYEKRYKNEQKGNVYFKNVTFFKIQNINSKS